MGDFFLKKSASKALPIQKKCLTLQPQNKNDGSLAQLNRASDYGSEGYRFESYRSHKLDRTKGHMRQLVLSFF